MDLEIDARENRISINGTPVPGRRRWEAAVLGALLRGKHVSPQTACGAAPLDSEMRSLGQRQPLTRKQWSLLWQALEAMFTAAGAADAFRARLGHVPRSRTVGPWWWVHKDGDSVRFVQSPAERRHSRLARLCARNDPANTARLCREALVFKALSDEGDVVGAAQALESFEASWASASVELRALRLIRLADMLARQRRFAAAREALARAEEAMATSEVAATCLAPTLFVVSNFMTYVESPTDAFAAIGKAIRPLLQKTSQTKFHEADLVARGALFNLAALCERRWIEGAPASTPASAIQEHVALALSYWFAALYCYLVSALPQQVHNVCSNVAYFFQRLYALEHESTADKALEWYALAQAWHNRFDLPDNTVWEYIFIGDLWLYSPQVRPRLKDLRQQGLWAGRHPSASDFYEFSAQRAREIGDPRQLAHALLNHWHFARTRRRPGEAQTALASLVSLFRGHPKLVEVLDSEGYVLPPLEAIFRRARARTESGGATPRSQ